MARFEVVSRQTGEKKRIGFFNRDGFDSPSLGVAQGFADVYAYEDLEEGVYFVRTVEDHHEVYDVYYSNSEDKLMRQLRSR